MLENKPMESDNTFPRVSVVVVTYRSTEELPECIDSVLNQPVSTEIFIVDNASPDETPVMVSEYGRRYKNVISVLNKENVGLAAGNNCILGKAIGDYILLLNPDTLLRKDTLKRMIQFLDENNDVGVLGPKSVFENGKPHTSFHRSWGIRHILLWRIFPYQLSRWLYDRFSSYEKQEVLFVSGACLLIRRSIFEQIGGYDPEYFLTVEDVADLCIRVRATGARILYYPEAEVMHYTGRSGVQVPYIVQWHSQRGTVYHFLKHKGVFQALVVTGLLMSVDLARVVVEGLLGIFSKRYRRAVGPYARVFWMLLTKNPLWSKS